MEFGPPTQAARRRRAAFTLVELLVVIAIVAVLASLLLPALAQARQRAQGARCLENHRQLSLALHLYTDDFDGRLPYNYGADGIRRTVADGRFGNWVNNVMSWSLDAENTNRHLLAAGGLGPYVAGADVYRCPPDRVLSPAQRRAGWESRTRTVSLNAMMGYAGGFLTGAVNTNNPGYRQFFRLGDVPAPARMFTFIDEHPDSINDGYFLNRIAEPEWVDLPASFHGNAATLSFADGHAELRRWLDASTRVAARAEAAVLPLGLPAGEARDFAWLMERMSVGAYADVR